MYSSPICFLLAETAPNKRRDIKIFNSYSCQIGGKVEQNRTFFLLYMCCIAGILNSWYNIATVNTLISTLSRG